MHQPFDIGRNRKRTGNVQRSALIRERIEDYLMSRGGKRSTETYLRLRDDFVNAAVRTAARAGLRTWKEPQKNAAESLKVLFGEKSVVTPGKGGSGAVHRTGVNAAWVLDIWEATLDHLVREDPFTRQLEREIEIGKETPRPLTDAEAAELNEGGPAVVYVPKGAPLSVRMLDAYLNRDDEAIMRIAVELEQVECGR